jgi:cell division protein ZapA
MNESQTSGASPRGGSVVEIGGRSYRLRGGDPEHLQKLADRVDTVLRRVAGPEGPLDSYKVAVLAGLNLAAEDAESRRRWTRSLWDLRRRSTALEARLDRLRRELAANEDTDPV